MRTPQPPASSCQFYCGLNACLAASVMVGITPTTFYPCCRICDSHSLLHAPEGDPGKLCSGLAYLTLGFRLGRPGPCYGQPDQIDAFSDREHNYFFTSLLLLAAD